MSNAPDYYQNNGINLLDVIDGYEFIPGSIMKYIFRAYNPHGAKHDSPLDDLQKAKSLLDRLISQAQEPCHTPWHNHTPSTVEDITTHNGIWDVVDG